MNQKDSPYSTKLFLEKWKYHFDKNNEQVGYKALKGVRLIKNGIWSTYKNTTSNLTLQHCYEYLNEFQKDLYNKIVMVYDVPDYFQVSDYDFTKTDRIQIKKIKEYNGYLIDLKTSIGLDDYLKTNFNSKNRSQFRSYFKKLENSFSISYKMFHGDMDKEEYDFLIQEFFQLSVRSFDYRKIKNRKLLPNNFGFLKDVFYDMILDKKACIFVIFDGNKPIGICLNYTSKNILFGDSTVYDLDYSKFNIGILMLIKQIEWCFENKINKYDFSKGHFPYKEKWCNVIYSFEHHIIYDSSKIIIRLKVFLIKMLLDLKQYLREHPFRKHLTTKIFATKRKKIENYQIISPIMVEQKNLKLIILSEYPIIRMAVNDFLFSNPDKKNTLKIYLVESEENIFLIKGENNNRWFKIVRGE